MHRNTELHINIDDFGLDLSINEAVEELFTEGHINSTSAIGNTIDENGLILLRKLNNRKLKTNLHINLVEGPILSNLLKEELNQESFPAVSEWLSRENIPSEMALLSEFQKQLERFTSNNIRIDGIDYHTMYPITNQRFYALYQKFAKENLLPFRGQKIFTLRSNLIRSATLGTFSYLTKALYNHPLITFTNIAETYRRNIDTGSYFSDFSFMHNSKNIPDIVKFFQENEVNDKIELIAHAANIKIYKTNLPIKRERYLEYLALKTISL